MYIWICMHRKNLCISVVNKKVEIIIVKILMNSLKEKK